MLFSPLVTTLKYNAKLCINCGMCVAVCPHACFAAGSKVVSLVQPDLCMECGACQKNCPTAAIQVESGTGCAEAMIRAALRGHKDMAPEACT
jgi:ferredoxin